MSRDINAYWRHDSRYYKEPRTPEDTAEQELLYEQAQAIGNWEVSHRVPETNRITWWNGDFGSFVPKEYVTPEQLISRHNEITETVPAASLEKAAASTAEAPEMNESERNFAAWMAVTESSRYKWVEDEIYRLNGHGAMYYTGGEDGIYMRIHKDGMLMAGSYEGAVPHIGEAMFNADVVKKFPSFNDAYTAAMEAGGKQFLVDMFSGGEPQPLFQTKRGAQGEKTSVLKNIREAQKAPKPPRGDKPQNQRKHKGDVEH